MPLFTTETTLCCMVIVHSKAKEEDLFEHQAEDHQAFEVEVFPVEFSALLVGETLGFITKDQAKEGLAKAAKVGLLLIGKLIQGVSKSQKRKKRRRSRKKRNKQRKMKGGSLWAFGPLGKLMAAQLGLFKKAGMA